MGALTPGSLCQCRACCPDHRRRHRHAHRCACARHCHCRLLLPAVPGCVSYGSSTCAPDWHATRVGTRTPPAARRAASPLPTRRVDVHIMLNWRGFLMTVRDSAGGASAAGTGRHSHTKRRRHRRNGRGLVTDAKGTTQAVGVERSLASVSGRAPPLASPACSNTAGVARGCAADGDATRGLGPAWQLPKKGIAEVPGIELVLPQRQSKKQTPVPRAQQMRSVKSVHKGLAWLAWLEVAHPAVRLDHARPAHRPCHDIDVCGL